MTDTLFPDPTPFRSPKRPEATCLIFEFASRLSPSGLYRRGSSPPSPVLDRPPRRFMARAMSSCASGESAPSDIAPVTKRRVMRSEEHTSELQSLMRNSYAVFSLQKKKNNESPN